MVIQLKDLQFSYPGSIDQIVLNIEQWSLVEREHVLVHGPSGCGKSSLLNILSGMLKANQGEVSVLGERLDQMSSGGRDQFRANHIGYVFQQFNLIPYLNAMDNILLAGHFSTRKNEKASDQEIQDLLASLKIDKSEWFKPASQLSIGQQQRVAIARALINKPELLIADEPTSSLDQGNREAFMEVLMSLVESHNMTLLFVSHDMSMFRYFDRVEALTDINRTEVSQPCS